MFKEYSHKFHSLRILHTNDKKDLSQFITKFILYVNYNCLRRFNKLPDVRSDPGLVWPPPFQPVGCYDLRPWPAGRLGSRLPPCTRGCSLDLWLRSPESIGGQVRSDHLKKLNLHSKSKPLKPFKKLKESIIRFGFRSELKTLIQCWSIGGKKL